MITYFIIMAIVIIGLISFFAIYLVVKEIMKPFKRADKDMGRKREARLLGVLTILADILVVGGLVGALIFLHWVWLIASVVGLWKLNFYRRLLIGQKGGGN